MRAKPPQLAAQPMSPMAPLCPACRAPMKEQRRAFQCEPCRQIVIFFAVSDASPYVESRRVLPKKHCTTVGSLTEA
jgi:hypothetical protein